MKIFAIPIFPSNTMPPQVAERFCAGAGKREVSGSIPDLGCRPSRFEFSVIFSEPRVNTG